nr:FAD-dependent oxidoreductase [Candidatus Sigynarchaeota archaeon]
MKRVDVLVIGAGIAGSVAAMQSAKFGFDTLFIEKKKVPRYKVCSGIQFGYFEKLVGKRFPEQILCSNEINNIEMI